MCGKPERNQNKRLLIISLKLIARTLVKKIEVINSTLINMNITKVMLNSAEESLIL